MVTECSYFATGASHSGVTAKQRAAPGFVPPRHVEVLRDEIRTFMDQSLLPVERELEVIPLP